MDDRPVQNEKSLTYSVVIELENATTICWDEVRGVLQSLTSEIQSSSFRGAAGAEPDGAVPADWRPQVLFCHADEEARSGPLRDELSREFPLLAEVARISCLAVPGGRYYELKNAGIAQADGEVIVLLDSDAQPEPGWLQALLAPFQLADTICVNGYTYLGHSDFISRTLALIWVFPLRHDSPRAVERRALNVNNCAFLARWLKANPIPIDNGFKVGCTKLASLLEQQSARIVRSAARAAHAPLRGWRFLLWRGLVTGRDADRKYADLKSSSRIRRMMKACEYWYKVQVRSVRRVISLHRQVQMPWWEVPGAVLVGTIFALLIFLGQAARALGLIAERVETVPAYAEHH
jgi:hypothetical protein